VSNSDDDISNLLDELDNFTPPTPNIQRAVVDTTPLDPKNVEQYIIDKSKALIEAGLGAVQDLTPLVVSSSDSREIEALSKLMASTAQALDTLQKSALIDKKSDRDEQMERLKLQGKKELSQLSNSAQHVTNNNFLVASREEIMKQLFGTSSDEPLTIEHK
jgi:hypothetical protein